MSQNATAANSFARHWLHLKCPVTVPRSVRAAIAPALLMACAPLSAGDPVTIEQISAAWREREEIFKSADVEYVKTGRLVRPPRRTQEPIPELDAPGGAEQNVRLRLVLDGELYRHEREGKQWDMNSGSFQEFEYVVLYDGADFHKYAAFPTSNEETHNVGTTIIGDDARQRSANLREQHNVPLVQALRPMNPRFGCIFTSYRNPWRLGDPNATLHEKPCIILENEFRDGKPAIQWWLGREPGFPLRRIKIMQGAQPVMQIDVEYREDPSWGMLPVRWSATRYLANSGKLRESYDVDVTRIAINQPVDRSFFRADYPVGTYVREVPEKGGDHRYVALEGGARREVTPDELARGVSYEELLQTKSGQAGIPASGTGAVWLVAVGGAAALLLAAYLYLRRRSA